MAAVISVLIILCCIVLILAVLIQNPKGGGLASGFQSGAQVMGVRRTADFLEKASWTLAVLLFIFSIIATSQSRHAANTSADAPTSTTKDKAGDFDKKTPNTNAPAASPFQPAPAPSPPAPGQQK